MKTRLLLFLLAAALAGPASAQFITIRISVKVVLHPTTGARPAGITDQLFADAAEAANEWQAMYFRGYRFRVDEVVNIGGPGAGGGATGPSKWFGQDPRSPAATWASFQNDINTDARYQRRTNQVNVYVTTSAQADGGGACPIPPGEANLIACHGLVNTGRWWMNHELGHFFGLPHTFAGESGNTPGDDGISDTLPDCNCWSSVDQVANYHYGMPYANLSAGQKNAVDNCYFNVMSYHEAATKDTVENRMTELQLDRVANTGNGSRAAFVTGRTVFLSTSGSDSFPFNGSSVLPYRTLNKGVSESDAGGGDILLLRPGNYNEQLTINRPVTLRAPRTGWVTLGKP